LPATSPTRPAPDKTAKATAQAFEAVFLGQMTQMMLEAGQAEGSAPGGHGEEMFRGVLAEKLGTEIARRGGIGIAPAVLQQIIRMQGGNTDGQ
jgi:Rod binding domain-containing protein